MMKSKTMNLGGRYSTPVGGKLIATEQMNITKGFNLNGIVFKSDCSFPNCEITVTGEHAIEVKSAGVIVDISDVIQ